jgi:prepilin-type N-terminal cleavage/methylation domain-containing protein
MHKRNTHQGFTLIEILVVIAIISLLSSVVFATLKTAKEKARIAQVVENIHQMETAFQMLYDAHGCWPGESGLGTCVTTATSSPTIESLIVNNDFGMRNYLSQAPVWPFDPTIKWGYDNDIDNASSTCLAFDTQGVNIYPMASGQITFATYSTIEQLIDSTPIAETDLPSAKYCGKVRFGGNASTPGGLIITLSYTQ